MDYSDLRNKTIFDFTDDEALIKKITGYTSKDKYIDGVHHVNFMNDVIALAQVTGDKELEKQADKFRKIIDNEWQDELDRLEKENPGVIFE